MAHVQTFRNIDEALMEQLKERGCFELFIGIESGSPKILGEINKTKDLPTIIGNLTKVFKAGINIKGYFIYSFPGESQDDMQMTFELAKELKELSLSYGVNFRTSVFQYRPYHSTQIYHDLEAQGKNLEVTQVEPNKSLSGLVGRQQFNFHSGNYSAVGYQLVEDYICRTINLNGSDIFSGLGEKPKICKKRCKSRGLDVYQGPVFDKIKKSQVFWVGLSAVKFDEGQVKLPLSPLTASGSLIHSIEQPFQKEISFYKTNLVKCAPLKDHKIRYPIMHEMEKCFSNFEWELNYLKPKAVFLLGKQVATFVLNKLSDFNPQFNDRFKFEAIEVNGIKFIPIHHPSYILVYKRKFLDQYVSNIQNLFPIKLSCHLSALKHELV